MSMKKGWHTLLLMSETRQNVMKTIVGRLLRVFGTYVESFEEAAYGSRVAAVFALVFAKLAGLRVEGPRLGDLDIGQLNHDIARLDAGKVVGEMGADSERGDTLVGRIVLDLYRTVHIQAIAEDHLLGLRVYVERPVFLDNKVELFVIVSAVYAESLEHVGIV